MVATVSCKLKLNNDGLNEILRACKELTKKIRVGYLSNSDLAQKAAQNEFGGTGFMDDGKKIEIPPRPFIQHAMDTYKKEILNAGNSFIKDDFTKETIRDKMITVAQTARDAIKVSIEDVKDWSLYPHNSPRTIEQKGFDKPLVDTGSMKSDVEYKIGG